jgi:hypothetical protein
MPASNEPDDVSEVRELTQSARLQRLVPQRGSLPPEDEPIVICVIRNERCRLGEFLNHYRSLGARRFFFIDNGSTDYSTDLLIQQPDVDLFYTNQKFNWKRKQGWINRLIDDHCRDHWYLLVDADEHVVFAGSGNSSVLRDVTARMMLAGKTRIRGCLIDMYSEGAVLATYREPGMAIGDLCPYFDPGGYAEHRSSLLISRVGGPRRRVFSKFNPDLQPQLTKYPLFRLCPGEIAANPHYIWPPQPAADDRCYLGILHYKFDGDFLLKIADATERQQYWRKSTEYHTYQKAFRSNPLLSLYHASSRRYRSPDDFVSCGLIEPILDSDKFCFDHAVRATVHRTRARRLANFPTASR